MNEKSNGHQKNLNPSALMSAYNHGKSWAKRTGLADTKRVDRAFGYLMSGEASEKWSEYATTTTRCDCPDHQFRGSYCKHILSLLIATKHDQIMDEEIYLPMAA